MDDTIKLFFSIGIGLVASLVAKNIHPNWSINNLLIFGAVVSGITYILTTIIKK